MDFIKRYFNANRVGYLPATSQNDNEEVRNIAVHVVHQYAQTLTELAKYDRGERAVV